MSKAESSRTLTAPFSAWGRLAANAAAHTTEHLFGAVIAVVLPLITSSLGLSMAQAGALVSTRTLMAGVASIPSGFLADLASRRNILLGLCLIMLGLGSLGMSLAPSFAVLLLFMGLSGMGGGGFHPQSLAILSTTYREKRAFAIGVHDSSGNLGEVLGPLAIGLLLTFFDWRTTLQLWALPGLAIGLLYAGFGAEAEAPLSRTKDYRRSLWEKVLTNRVIFGLVAVSTFRAMGQTAVSAFLPLYLSLHLKLPASTTGLYMSILYLFAGTAPTVAGWVSDRLGRNFLIAACSIVSTCLILAVPYLGSGLLLNVGLAALGVVLWALRPVVITAAMEAAPQNLAGSIVAFVFTANMGVSFIAPIMAGLVADAYGLPAAIISIALFPFLASIVAFLLLILQRVRS
ncbi:MAG TPA: MFS transporter [Candidatus Binatia bacterium]|nr:MFS transporter [Candidatus Binatia bacterium]